MKTSFLKKPQTSLFLTLASIGLLLLLLMIPNGMIRNLIHERNGFEQQTKQEVANTWGSDQTLVGPILSIPYTIRKSHEVNGKTKSYLTLHHLHITPSILEVDGKMSTTALKKSIYDIWLYTTDLTMSGEIEIGEINIKDAETIKWDEATLTIGVNDGHGIEGNILAQVSGNAVEFNPGSLQQDIIAKGVSAKLNLAPTELITFDINFALRGSESLNFVPIASDNKVILTSDWHSPGFVGVLSPSHREVSTEGFEVIWEAGKFSKNNPDRWSDIAFNLNVSRGESFGVELVEPVNHYQKNIRSAKYAFLILSLTFLIFFFYELVNGTKVHPIQYLLIGLSLTVFYLLLLSLTEHIGFDKAYGIAALATISSIIMYTKSLFKQASKSVVFGLILLGLYSYIFVLLQLEAYALLAGSIGVFLILSTIMYLTRSINFYNTEDVKESLV